MADDRAAKQPDEGKQGSRAQNADADTSKSATPAWGDLWQVPTIIISIILISVGIYIATLDSPEEGSQSALAQAGQLIHGGYFDEASTLLTEQIQPNIGEATPEEQALYHATVADWLACWQQSENINLFEHNQRIDQEYGNAKKGGFQFNPARIERWALALIDLGKIEEAQQCIEELEALDLRSMKDDIRMRRNRVLRRLVEKALHQKDLASDALFELLNEYQKDSRLSAADFAWGAARQAELNLELGDPEEAIHKLLVDIRRVERRVEETGQSVSLAELTALLGRGYFDIGEYEYADHHIQNALNELDGTDQIRGGVLVLAGMLHVLQDELEDAFSNFDEAVREYPSSRGFVPALFNRAETRSKLGDHNGAIADYERLINLVMSGEPRRDITPQRVSQNLCDRHDAALATNQLTLALDYTGLAERLFPPSDVPRDVLLRAASSHRQMADNLLMETDDQSEQDQSVPSRTNPVIRNEANEHYDQAGDYFVRYARTSMLLPDQDEQWAEALWQAADSFDLGGRPDKAIRHFQEYISGRPMEDPHRADVVYRLAQAYQAEREYEQAVQHYEQVIKEHPRSPQASHSHVYLARCLIELDRVPEAKQLLIRVVEGNGILTPQSRDYRDALIFLGTMNYEMGEYTDAIEHLSLAVEYYPDDERVNELIFRLGDSFRGSAEQIAEFLASDATIPVREQQRLSELRQQHLHRAFDELEKAATAYSRLDPHELTAEQRRFQRNTHLYCGDTAFALSEFERAIGFYDYVARVHNKHSSSITALIQIVNCYGELRDWERAAAAHQRAQSRLAQMPDEAFDAPDAIMNRQAWELWFVNNPPLTEAETHAAATDSSESSQ